jgi:hypothetical protein
VGVGKARRRDAADGASGEGGIPVVTRLIYMTHAEWQIVVEAGQAFRVGRKFFCRKGRDIVEVRICEHMPEIIRKIGKKLEEKGYATRKDDQAEAETQEAHDDGGADENGPGGRQDEGGDGRGGSA